MDSIPGILIFLIPAIIIIGRIAAAAQKKKAGPPPPIPVHFADDDDDDEVVPFSARKRDEVYPMPKAAPVPAKKPVSSTIAPSFSSSLSSPPPEAAKPAASAPAAHIPTRNEVPVGQQNFLHMLNRLSPMKQAVVMAEVLGTPKGLQEM